MGDILKLRDRDFWLLSTKSETDTFTRFVVSSDEQIRARD